MNNYKDLYTQYWSSDDRWGQHSFKDPEEIAEGILATCGPGKMLDVGCGMGLLVRTLVHKGIDVFGMDVIPLVVEKGNQHLPARFIQGSILEIPFANKSFDTVISTDCLEHLAEADVCRALTELFRVSRRYVYVRISTIPDRDSRWHLTIRDREWWETQFFEAGFRKHPAYYLVNDYEALERDETSITIVLEKIPHKALELFPLESLKPERDLHNDMLREHGRRSDAHIIRYKLAAQFVRPGDVVLDIACGLGYGSAVIEGISNAAKIVGIDASGFAVKYATANYVQADSTLTFQQGDALALSSIPDNSADVIVSFETLEHLEHPEVFLHEVQRILKPSGRVIASVPNDWTDETGKDPNPFHHHVYTWKRLYCELSRHFLVEKAYAQVGGGGMKLTQHPRRLREFQPDSDQPPIDAEWFIIVGMKDPVPRDVIDYQETTFPGCENIPLCNVVAFKRDYRNPWLVKGIVSIGLRNTNPQGLRQIAERVEQQSSDAPVDFGAALCVAAYQVLDSYGEVSEIENILQKIDDYLNTNLLLSLPSPHITRWMISLAFVKGRLLTSCGRFSEAEKGFVQCASMDELSFSPLLATKTVEALFWAGMFALHKGEAEICRDYWHQALVRAQQALNSDWTNIWGSADNPLEFGLNEAATILHKASRCAFGILSLKDYRLRPGFFWNQLKRDWDSQLNDFEQLKKLKSAWYEPEIGRLQQAVSDYERLKREWYEPEIGRLQQAVSDCEQLKREWYEPEIGRLQQVVSDYEQLKRDWYEPELGRLKQAVSDYEPEIGRLQRAVSDCEQLKREWYEPEIGRLQQVVSDYETLNRDWYEPEIARLNKVIESTLLFRIKKMLARFIRY